MKGFVRFGLLALLVLGFSSTTFAKDKTGKIQVTVMVEKKIGKIYHVFAIGFSVNNKDRGSLGRSTKKSGPANAKYAFGFKGTAGSISCGTAVLKRDSVVLLYFKNKRCINKVFIKK